ncbi:MAG: hypothetical protein ACE5FK_04505 [Candidatus Methylomirabilia bacterium]
MLKGLLWTAFFLAAVVELLIATTDAALPWWHRLPAFHAVYGVVGCALIVIVSKVLGKLWLQRPEAGDD